jgi:hypothetical protein
MKRIGTTLSMLVLAGSLAGNAIAAEQGILEKERLSDSENYCHMKFSAIEEGTLASNNPQVKPTSSGDVIDFYGPCDETPTSPDQVTAQRLDESRHNPASEH